MINSVVLVGRLTKDPELRFTPNGVATCSFTLAVNRPFTSQGGEREADFIPVVVWRQQAENTANYVKKGHLTGVTGRIQTRNYENAEGRRVYITEVVAESVQFLEPKGSGGNATNNQTNNQKQGQGPYNDPFTNTGNPIDISDDDLPF